MLVNLMKNAHVLFKSLFFFRSRAASDSFRKRNDFSKRRKQERKKLWHFIHTAEKFDCTIFLLSTSNNPLQEKHLHHKGHQCQPASIKGKEGFLASRRHNNVFRVGGKKKAKTETRRSSSRKRELSHSPAILVRRERATIFSGFLTKKRGIHQQQFS